MARSASRARPRLRRDISHGSEARRIADLETRCARLSAENRRLRDSERAMRESEELYRHTLELAEQFAWTADADGYITHITPTFAALIGARQGEDLVKVWKKAVHPADFPIMLESARRALAERRRCESFFRMRMPNGELRWFAARAVPLFGKNGELVRWYGITEDVHESREAERALRDADERYRLAVLATHDVIWDYDLVSNRVVWNDATAPIFGYEVGEGPTPLGWWNEKLHPDDHARVSASFAQALQNGWSNWAETYRFRDASGEYRNIFDRGFIIHDEQGRSIRAVGSMSDITDRRRAEEKLQRVQAELVHVSRLSAMGALASTLAHELNQPLTAITNYMAGSSRLLAGGASNVDAVRVALEAAESSAIRAGEIVRGLRELVARGNVRIRREELHRIVEDAAVLAFVDAKRQGVTHSVRIDPAAHWVEADRVQLQQVIINLVRNAVEAMKGLPRREITIGAVPLADGMIEVSVADTGHGLPEKIRDALFSPFHGTSPDGMGIGLSICRTIVEAHGGRIWADDAPDGGAVFRFTVPRSRRPVDV